eukprot:g9265.t1
MNIVSSLSSIRAPYCGARLLYSGLHLQNRRPSQRVKRVLLCQQEPESIDTGETVEESLEKEAEIAPQEESTGPVGLFVNFLTWSFIILLFAGSVFFTVSRQFLPDMQPIDLSNPPL